MVFQQKSTNVLSVDWLVQFLHFFRLHQLVYQLTLVAIILFFIPSSSAFQVISALLLILLITPSFLLMQDVLGKKDDEKFGQKRILFSDRVNKLFFFSSMLIMMTILVLNSLFSLLSYVLLFISTLGYAAMKYFHKMYISYLFRSLSSVFTFLLYLFIFVNVLNEQLIDLLVLVALLDLVGNIAGDIRDSGKDTIAGVKTLVTTKGRIHTLYFMCLLVLFVFGLLVLKYQSPVFILLLVFNILPFLFIEQLSVRLSHGIFHLMKLINYLVIAFVLSCINIFLFTTVLGFIIGTWSFSYYFYLYKAMISTIPVQKINQTESQESISL